MDRVIAVHVSFCIELINCPVVDSEIIRKLFTSGLIFYSTSRMLPILFPFRTRFMSGQILVSELSCRNVIVIILDHRFEAGLSDRIQVACSLEYPIRPQSALVVDVPFCCPRVYRGCSSVGPKNAISERRGTPE